MGKIKQKLVTRAGKEMISKGIQFSEKFDVNKKILGKEMPSKKVRNQIAGYLARTKKFEKEKQNQIEESLKIN